MNDGRNILSDDKAKALREIIEQEEAGRAAEHNCTNCRKWAECMEGPLTPGEMRHATCWVPESRADKHIECDPRRGWRWAEDLTPSTEELLEGVRLHETPAREMMNPPELAFEIADDGGTIYKRIAEVFDRSAAEALVRSEIELAKKRAPIIAVDFDGTLCENAWPDIGATKWETVQALIAARAAGARLVLWTNRVGARLREAVEWCRNRELEFDAVNENLPEVLAAFTTDCRKVYADIYLDDHAAQPSAAVLGQLWETARETMNEAATAEAEKKTKPEGGKEQ